MTKLQMIFIGGYIIVTLALLVTVLVSPPPISTPEVQIVTNTVYIVEVLEHAPETEDELFDMLERAQYE